MNRIPLLLVILFVITTNSLAWKSNGTQGESAIIFGTLITQEGNTHHVTNVNIGKSRNDQSKIVLYEKPKHAMIKKQGPIIPVNPSEGLTTTVLELSKVRKIVVPEPTIIWNWTNLESKRSIKPTYEYIELIITWQDGSKIPYLIELGQKDNRSMVKVFCDVIDKKMTGIKQNGIVMCPKTTKDELRKKGAPFPSIKELILEEPCYKVPTDISKVKLSN